MRQTRGPTRSREGYHWFRGWRKPTAAQRRVLEELVAGGTNAQIAERLGISEDGVKWHLSELRDETGVADRRELAQWWAEERRRPAVHLLVPFAGLWRLASQNVAAVLVVGGVVAASLAAGWFAYDGLRGDDDAVANGAAALRTPAPAAAAPLVPTPTPTPGPRGALLFDVATGETRILPGDYQDRRWLDSEALTFAVYGDQGRIAVIDAEGEVEPISERTGVTFEPDAGEHRVVIWDWNGGRLEVVDTESGAVELTGEFGQVPSGTRRWAVSPQARKVAIADNPYQEITVYALNATQPRTAFTAEPDRRVSHFAWSPGGEWLLVVTALINDLGPQGTDERTYVFDPDGNLVLQRDSGADWAGVQTLRLRKRDDMTSGGGPLITDALLDMAHESEIPVPDGGLLCVSPDSRYAVQLSQVFANGPPYEHQLYDLVRREVVASVELDRYLINCDWASDGSKVVLSSGGK